MQDPSPSEKFELNRDVVAIIRRSDLYSPDDPPEVVAALMVLLFGRHLGVPHRDIPAELLKALSGLASNAEKPPEP